MEATQKPDDKANDKPQKKVIVNKLVLLGDVYVGKTSIAYRYALKCLASLNAKQRDRFTKGEFSDFQESTVGTSID